MNMSFEISIPALKFNTCRTFVASPRVDICHTYNSLESDSIKMKIVNRNNTAMHLRVESLFVDGRCPARVATDVCHVRQHSMPHHCHTPT